MHQVIVASMALPSESALESTLSLWKETEKGIFTLQNTVEKITWIKTEYQGTGKRIYSYDIVAKFADPEYIIWKLKFE